MNPSTQSRILFHFWTGFLANIFFILLVLGLKSLPPLENINISAQDDGLILSGQTVAGLNQILTFKNWNELEKYLTKHKIEIIPASEVALGGYVNAHFKIEDSIRLYRDSAKDSIALQLPDLKSAQVFQENLRFGNLFHGPFGFSLRAENTMFMKLKNLLNRT